MRRVRPAARFVHRLVPTMHPRTTGGSSVTVHDLLRDRVVTIREALADGDTDYAADLAADLEHDLAGALEHLREAA